MEEKDMVAFDVDYNGRRACFIRSTITVSKTGSVNEKTFFECAPVKDGILQKSTLTTDCTYQKHATCFTLILAPVTQASGDSDWMEDGSEKTSMSDKGVVTPKSFAIDPATPTLYYFDSFLEYIRAVDYEKKGRSRQIVE